MTAVRVEAVAYRSILRGISAQWAGGEMVGVIGPNGAGKSTLLRILAGVRQPTQGAVTVDGARAAHLQARARARLLSFMPQQLAEDIPYTVAEFVEMGLYAHRDAWGQLAKEQRGRVAAALARMNLAPHARTPLAELSGGERQRAAVARCLAQGSPVILLDEPIANLDLYYQVEILAELARLASEGRLVILAIHNLELAARYCSSLFLLGEGRLRAAGKPEHVLAESTLREVFRVDAKLFRDPYSGSLRLSLGGSAQAQAVRAAEPPALREVAR